MALPQIIGKGPTRAAMTSQGPPLDRSSLAQGQTPAPTGASRSVYADVAPDQVVSVATDGRLRRCWQPSLQ